MIVRDKLVEFFAYAERAYKLVDIQSLRPAWLSEKLMRGANGADGNPKDMGKAVLQTLPQRRLNQL